MQNIWYLLIVFALVQGPAFCQNCDLVNMEKEWAAKINAGTYEELAQLAGVWMTCARSDEDIYRGVIFQYIAERNTRKFNKAWRFMQKADSIYVFSKKIKKEKFPLHDLNMAEAAALSRHFVISKKYLNIFFQKNKSQHLKKQTLALVSYIKGLTSQNNKADFEQALRHYRNALHLFLELPAPPVYHTGQTLRSLGNTSRALGSFRQAVYYYERELALYEKNYPAGHKDIAIAHYNTGAVWYELSRYEEALGHFLSTLQTWQQQGAPSERYMRYLHEAIGDMYWELDDHQEALRYYDKAVAGEEPVNNDESVELLRRGRYLFQKGEETAARLHFQKALQWRIETYGRHHAMTGACQHFIGSRLLEAGHLDEAIEAFQQVIAMLVPDLAASAGLPNPPLSATPLSEHGLLNALASKGIALTLRHRMGGSEKDARLAFETLGLAIEWMGRLRQRPVPDADKALWPERHRDVFGAYISMSHWLYGITGKSEYLRAAFVASEKSRAFLLQSALQTQHALAFAGVPDSLVSREKALQKAILRYEGKISLETQRCGDARTRLLELWQQQVLSLKNQYAALLQYMEQNHPRYHRLKYNFEPASIEKLQKKLLADGRSALIEFFDAPAAVFTFIVTQEGLQLFRTEKDSLYLEQLSRLMANLSSPRYFLSHPARSYSEFCADAHALYQLLLARPLSACPVGTAHLYVVPDGALSHLPLACLLTRPAETSGRDYRRLPWLLHHFTTSYSPSASLLCLPVPKRRPSQPYVAFAPAYGSIVYSDIPALFANDKEARCGAALMGGHCYTGSAATESIFKQTAPAAAILHLPVHAVVNSRDPMLSHLLFLPDNTDDGIFHSFELYNLRLSAGLTVLSACQSGSGPVQMGEGMMSLERGFHYAGCPALLTTLWTVDDAATAALSVSFLKNIKSGMEKDRALARAQLDYLAGTDAALAHPFYWAGLRLSGEVAPLPPQPGQWPTWWWWIPIVGGVVLIWIIRRKRVARMPAERGPQWR